MPERRYSDLADAEKALVVGKLVQDVFELVSDLARPIRTRKKNQNWKRLHVVHNRVVFVITAQLEVVQAGSPSVRLAFAIFADEDQILTTNMIRDFYLRLEDSGWVDFMLNTELREITAYNSHILS